jgi:hypothetical protein
VSRAGDGHVDCWGASDERHSICEYMNPTNIVRHVYRCTGEKNLCIQVKDICSKYDNCLTRDSDKLCDWLRTDIEIGLFYCRNGTVFYQSVVQCNGKLECADGEDEWFCDLKITGPMLTRFNEIEFPLYYIDLQNITTQTVDNIDIHVPASSYLKSDWYCNRGMPITDGEERRCLCPSSYSGERCENQRERISIILQIILTLSIQQDVAIKFVVYLIDIITLNILAEEEIVHLAYVHSLYKHLISLSSVRANNSFVRIDAYEVSMQRVVGYRTSWKFNLPFPFLPVRRLVARLIVFDDENSVSQTRFTCHTCVHGQCLSYQNSQDRLCRCDNGWTGQNCNTSFVCASGAQSLNSLRCLCPLDRRGIRCFAPNIAICQCHNDATCISLDARTGQSACLCSGRYFGTYCERQHASLTIEAFDEHQPEILPIVLFQFVQFTTFGTTNFENIFLHERVSSRRSLVIYHMDYEQLPLMVLSKIFYSSSIDDYRYYILLYMSSHVYIDGIRPKHIQLKVETKQQCVHVREMDIFKRPINIFTFPYIKRIKFLSSCMF